MITDISMRQYGAEELNGIFTTIAPPRGLAILSPVSPGAPPASGPAVCVSLRYSDIVPEQKY